MFHVLILRDWFRVAESVIVIICYIDDVSKLCFSFLTLCNEFSIVLGMASSANCVVFYLQFFLIGELFAWPSVGMGEASESSSLSRWLGSKTVQAESIFFFYVG